MNIMKLNDIARQLVGSAPATLVTINRDGSPQVSVVWVTVQSTADGGDELVTAHLQEHQKIRNIRRDPRVAVTIVSTDRSGPQTPYLSIKGTARVEEGGAPELLDEMDGLSDDCDVIFVLTTNRGRQNRNRSGSRLARGH